MAVIGFFILIVICASSAAIVSVLFASLRNSESEQTSHLDELIPDSGDASNPYRPSQVVTKTKSRFALGSIAVLYLFLAGAMLAGLLMLMAWSKIKVESKPRVGAPVNQPALP